LEVLDTTFRGVSYVVYNGVAGRNDWDYGNSICLDKYAKIYVTGYISNSSGNTIHFFTNFGLINIESK
jgi:hypothetical protein